MSRERSLFNLVMYRLSSNDFSISCWEEIVQLNHNIVPITYDTITDVPSDTVGLLVGLGAKITKSDLKRLKCLRYIGVFGTGYGGIDIDCAKSRSVVVTNIADYSTHAVVEFTFSILLEKLRTIEMAKQQAGQGDYSDRLSGSEIYGKNFGIIGLGNIGLATAKIAVGFGANVSYWNRAEKSHTLMSRLSFQPDLGKLVSNADFISLNLVYNDQTRSIISKPIIDSIKPGAILINVSPMELIEFRPLVTRLKRGDIILILDHADEMSAQDLKAIKSFENVSIYPPIGYKTAEASRAKERIFIQNISSFLEGKPTSVVNN